MIRAFLNVLRAFFVILFIICGGIFWILYASHRALEQTEKPNDDARN